MQQISSTPEKERIINKMWLLTFHYWVPAAPLVHVPLINRCLQRAVVLGIAVHCLKTVLYKSVNYLVLIGKWFK